MAQISEWVDETDFLSKVALRYGKLLKGGEPDVNCVAVGVINDWQRVSPCPSHRSPRRSRGLGRQMSWDLVTLIFDVSCCVVCAQGKLPFFVAPPKVDGDEAEEEAGDDGLEVLADGAVGTSSLEDGDEHEQEEEGGEDADGEPDEGEDEVYDSADDEGEGGVWEDEGSDEGDDQQSAVVVAVPSTSLVVASSGTRTETKAGMKGSKEATEQAKPTKKAKKAKGKGSGRGEDWDDL